MRGQQTFKDFQSEFLAASFVLLFLIHPAITQQTFDMFNCFQLGSDPNGIFLVADVNQRCWVGDHRCWCLAVGIPMLLLYVFGISASAFSIPSLSGISSKSAKPFMFLYISYEERFWCWPLVVVTRQIFMVAITVS